MTKSIILFTASLIIFILAIRAAIKFRTKGESKLSVYEHPSVFKKPDIEMVNKSSKKDEVSDEKEKISIQIDDKRNADYK